jgi:hypothetical protein
MSAQALLVYILAALLLQIAAGIFVTSWRRSARLARVQPAVPVGAVSTNGWSGWRTLRVARREFEDAAQTQCSFYLEPVDGVALPSFLPGQFLTFELSTPTANGEAPRPLARPLVTFTTASARATS